MGKLVHAHRRFTSPRTTSRDAPTSADLIDTPIDVVTVSAEAMPISILDRDCWGSVLTELQQFRELDAFHLDCDPSALRRESVSLFRDSFGDRSPRVWLREEYWPTLLNVSKWTIRR